MPSLDDGVDGLGTKLDTATEARLIKEHSEFQKLYRAAEKVLKEVESKVQTGAFELSAGGQQAIGLNISTKTESIIYLGPTSKSQNAPVSSA